MALKGFLNCGDPGFVATADHHTSKERYDTQLSIPVEKSKIRRGTMELWSPKDTWSKNVKKKSQKSCVYRP